MPENTTAKNKRIAKNTLFLYFRMIVLLLVRLYTSRVVLDVLGIDDYGLYNVVAGIVIMFSFLSIAMITGTQRHLSYELGKENGNLPQIFSACFYINILLSGILLLLAETVGLWFLNTQVNVDETRIFAANIVYQISIVNFITDSLRTPYTASVIAYEKMSFYAYYSVIEAALKLLIVFLLISFDGDKLIAYAGLILLVTVFSTGTIVFYSHKKLYGIRFERVADKGLYKYLLSFSSWTLFGSIAGLLETQGLNLLINIFYGVTVNAAVGIATQVKSAVYQFVTGFQQSLNPQLVMAQSSGERDRQYDLIFKSSKFSFYILFLLSFPIILNMEYILQLWLVEVPLYTYQICILGIFVQLLECLSSPLYTTIFAIGNIKKYQMSVFCFRLISFMVGYILCMMHFLPYYIYMAPVLVALALLIYRLIFIHSEIGLSYKKYISNVLFPIILSSIISVFIMFIIKFCWQADMSIVQLIMEMIIAFLISGVSIYLLGLTHHEKIFIWNYIKNKLKLKYNTPQI